ncbi:ACVR2B [Bugula neritina]|uniref:Serine/threonine-protein kinase receptor n=1 Tax=Bugula neritina TaxID=10212 RepID=A0A7J7J622_BUGNE|nr:ACVR2B [Bugula neritina]
MLFTCAAAFYLRIFFVGLLTKGASSAVPIPSTPTCYNYNGTACELAKANKNLSAQQKTQACSVTVVTCMIPESGHSTCLAVWRQRINDTLPEHTDRTHENTGLLSCYPVISQGPITCRNECVATESGFVNKSTGVVSVSCCCTTPNCNAHHLRSINITYAEDAIKPEPTRVSHTKQLITGLIFGGVVLVCGSMALAAYVMCTHYKKKREKLLVNHSPLEQTDVEEETCFADANLSLQTQIAKGQYATVYQGGKINNVAVAIKCFTAAHRRMWQQENDIYRMPGLRQNRNIATFFGAKQNGSGNDLTLWLVLEYYPNGSIYDYLKGNVLTWPVMLKLAHSMMNGLAYLHDEVALPGGERRSLAHRDIKSKNIMIKNDMTAAIADFGLALCFKDGNVNEVDAQFQAGTHRYMAPEVLDGAISFTKDAFIRIDVYAAALVLWELLTRCEVSENRSSEYKAPYEDLENRMYSSLLETLQIAVSREKRRPSFPDCLYRNADTASLVTTIEESWDADAEARLSAGCIESRLANLLATIDDTERNNIRNLEPPPYASENTPIDEPSLPLISYN